jgi:predicted nuclease of predicted toxin-antitoxin system
LTRLLLDEHISPALVRKLGEKGLYAEAVAHVGLSGEPDEHIWNNALEHDFTVVTTNARDFIRLLNMEEHPGLIVLRESGLTLQNPLSIGHSARLGRSVCLACPPEM